MPPTSARDALTLKNATEAIRWDEDLCRPIYPVAKKEKGATDEIDEKLDQHNEEYIEQPNQMLKSRLSDAPVKRSKTFGGRKRIPVSFLLLNANQEAIPSPSSTSCSSSSNSTSSSPSTASNGDNTNREEGSTSTSLQFAGRAETPTKKRKIALPQEHVTLLKAKEYFEQLDTTQTLTLDSSDSPTKTSKITRTSRKVNLTSPRIAREYTAYADASQESGVSPLSILQYANSRREYFRKTELFDGFFDEM